MTELGAHLRLGKGVAWSEAQAMQWFAKAAQKGYIPAETSLAMGYENGLGQDSGQGRQDYQQAAYWYGRAVSSTTRRASASTRPATRKCPLESSTCPLPKRWLSYLCSINVIHHAVQDEVPCYGTAAIVCGTVAIRSQYIDR